MTTPNEPEEQLPDEGDSDKIECASCGQDIDESEIVSGICPLCGDNPFDEEPA